MGVDEFHRRFEAVALSFVERLDGNAQRYFAQGDLSKLRHQTLPRF